MTQNSFDSAITDALRNQWADYQRQNPNADPKAGDMAPLWTKWAESARKDIRRQVYQETLADLAAVNAPGIRRRETDEQGNLKSTSIDAEGKPIDTPQDDDLFGEYEADMTGPAHEYAVIRQNLFERGQRMPSWEEFEQNRPGKLMAMIQGAFINSNLAWESGARSIGQWIGRTGVDLAMDDETVAQRIGVDYQDLKRALEPRYRSERFSLPYTPSEEDAELLNKYDQFMLDMYEIRAKEEGDAWMRGARFASEVVSHYDIVDVNRMAMMGSDPTNVQDIRDVYGRAQGGALVKGAEMVGSAMGIIPYSVPALASRNPRIAAMLTTPFYAMGHSGAWERRLEIYRDQVAAARANGEPEPARPTLSSLNEQSRTAGFIEFGSEYVFDTAQKGLMGLLGFGTKVAGPGKLGANTIRTYANELANSMARRQGRLGTAKAVALVAAGGVVEGLEEAIPEAAKEITDPLYIPEGYENDFFSEDTAEAVGTGFIAGFITTGTVAGIGAGARRVSRARAEERALAEKAVGAAAGIVQQKADRLAAERLVQNSAQARGATMALHQIEEIGASDRRVMFVSGDVAEATITEDVKKRMEALGIPSKPIGIVHGLRVYAHADQAASVRQDIMDGNIGALTGHPAMKDPNLPAVGAIVVRNQSNQILEVLPYSSEADADSAQPAIQEIASRSGNIVTRASASELPGLSETMAVQMDTDARMRKVARPSRRGPTRQDVARGVHALRLDIATATSKSKWTGSRNDAFETEYLTAEEIGGAANKDVEVDVTLRPVAETQLSDTERRITLASGGRPTIVDGSVRFTITRPDGSKQVFEKPIDQAGAYLAQSSPDGLYLIRENGTAFTARNAMALLLHELRHQLVGRSRAGAKLMAQMMYLDPVLAMRGGIQYMRDYATESTTEMDPATNAKRMLSDEELVGRYAAMHAAAESVLSDPDATDADRAAAIKDRTTAEQFAEEMGAVQAEASTGQTLTAAAMWDPIYKNMRGMSARKFASWAGYHLTKAGWAGPWAKQALWELSQRQKGVSDAQLRIHDQMLREIEPKYREDMERNRQILEGSRSQVMPAVGAALGAAAAAPLAGAAGDDDDEIAAAGKALEGIGSLPPEQKGEALSKIISALSAVVPTLASASASITGTGSAGRTGVQPGKRQAPASQPQVGEVVAQPAAAPQPEARPTPMTSTERESMYRQRGEPMFARRRDIEENWAATSKAVDDGELTTVYVGNPTGFMEFDSQRMGRTERPVSIGAATSSTTDDGMWFTSSKRVASDAAGISSVNMLPQVSRILNAKTKRLADELPTSALSKFEQNAGQPLQDYRVSPENLAEFMDNDGDGYEGIVRGHAQYLSEMLDNDPAAVAKIDQAFQGTDIAVLAGDLAGSRGGVMRGAHLKLENPLIVPFKTGELISTDRGVIREDEPFVTQASDALDQMRANGNDGIIMEMPDGERRYFVRNPSQVQVIGAARDAREASMFAMRDRVDTRLQSRLRGPSFRVYEGDPRFDEATSQMDGVAKMRYNEISQDNLAGITGSPSVFHETSAANARSILKMLAKPFARVNPIAVSTSPDIAIGQGGRGIRLEMDTARVNGDYGAMKPGQDRLASQGLGEFKVDAAMRGAVSAIEVRSPAVEKVIRKDPAVERMFDWANPEKTEYGTRYRSMFAMRGKPTVQPDAADLQPVSDVMFSRRRSGKTPSIPTDTIFAASLENAQKIASSQEWGRNRDLKKAMQDAALKAAEKDGIDIRPMLSSYVDVADQDGKDVNGRAFSRGDKIIRSRNPQRTVIASDRKDVRSFEKNEEAVRSYLVQVGVKDSLAALSQNKTAKGWYDLKTRIALGVIALIHPEIVTDINARFAFIYALAVTSNGMRVMENFQLADKVYREFRRTGRMPTNYGTGKPAQAMNDAFAKFNQLVEAWGADNLRRMMMTEMTAGDITGLDKDLAIDGEWSETIVRGAAFLGPKIGNGFFSNLNGMFDALTMDRWLIRTWGRWTGTLISEMPEQTARARERMRSAIDALTPDQRKMYEDVLGSPIESDPSAAAMQIANRLSDKARRDRIPADSAMQEVRLAANRLDKYLDGQKEAPSGPAERNLIRDVFEEILTQIRMDPEYSDLTMADLQAALWYAEKRLYENSKETSTEKKNSDYNDLEAPDYANAATALALGAGIDSAAIKAVEEYENGRTGDARPPGVGQATLEAGTGQSVGTRGFAPKELAEFRSWVAANSARQGRIRDQGRGWDYTRVGGTSGRSRVLKSLNVTYVAEWNPGDKLRRAYRRNGLDTPTFYELERTRPNATKFRRAISSSRKRSTYGAAVYIYEMPEYAGMRLFLSEDGKAGFALKDDGDVVSVFSDKSVKHGRAAIELSIAAGGTKLDCFDTILPRFYSSHGFRVVQRLQWDDAQAPADWNKQTFSKFNNGEPDVVFMAYDKNAAPWSTYDANLMARTTDYGQAVSGQQRAVEAYAKGMSSPTNVPIQSQFSMRRGLRGVRDEAALRYVDKFDELLRYTRLAEERGTTLTGLANPYTAARLLTDRLGAMQRGAERRYADLLRRQYEAGVTLGEMDEFLTAQHAEERNRYVASINPAFPDGGSGMMTSDANDILDDHRNNGRFDLLEGFANEWRAMLNEALVQRRDAGLVTQDLYDRLTTRYQRYVPLRGAPAQIGDEDFEAWGEPGGSGLSTTGRGVPRSMGRRSEAQGVTSQVAYVHEDAFRRIARNQVGQAFLSIVRAVGDRAMAEVIRPRRRVLVNGVVRNVHDMGWMQDPRNFGVYVDQNVTINGHDYEPGDLVVIRINNRRLADAMTSPTLQLRSFERALTNVNNVWRFMTTGMGNPSFAPVNMLRDVGQAVLNNLARRGFVDTVGMMRRWPRAFMRVWMDNWINLEPSQMATPGGDRRLTGSYARFVEAGGDMVGWRGNDLEAKQTDFNALADRVARRDPNDRTLARTLLGWYSGFFAASETAARLAQFEQRVATGSSDYDAALAARDITVDFRKGGMAKPVLNTWYMFLNAGLQGTVNVAGAVARSLTLAPSLIMLGFAQAFMARTMGGDDEDTGQAKWDNIPEYEKTSNMYFFNPDRSGKYAKMPVPYGYNVFFSAGVRLEDVIYGRSTPADMASGMLVDALNAFNPIGGSGITGGTGNVLTSIMPTMVRPLGELAINEDFSGRPIYPRSYGKFPQPDSTMFFDGTPEAYISTADWLNKATGGDEFEAGALDMSPDTMEYLVGYYFSGTGRMLNRLYKVSTSGGDVNPNDVPVLRSFVGDASSDTRAISQRYNAIGAELAPSMRRLEAMDDENLPLETRRRAAMGVTATQQQLVESLKATDKALSEINRLLKGSEGKTRESLLETRRIYQKGLIRRKNELTDALRRLE